MSRDPLRLTDYLGHILESIRKIQTYCSDVDEVGFLGTPMLQDAVIRNFEIIGEASHNIEKVAPDFLNRHPDIPLLFAYEMRNALAHGYHKVDLEIVWRTIERDLPCLDERIREIVDQQDY